MLTTSCNVLSKISISLLLLNHKFCLALLPCSMYSSPYNGEPCQSLQQTSLQKNLAFHFGEAKDDLDQTFNSKTLLHSLKFLQNHKMSPSLPLPYLVLQEEIQTRINLMVITYSYMNNLQRQHFPNVRTDLRTFSDKAYEIAERITSIMTKKWSWQVKVLE